MTAWKTANPFKGGEWVQIEAREEPDWEANGLVGVVELAGLLATGKPRHHEAECLEQILRVRTEDGRVFCPFAAEVRRL